MLRRELRKKNRTKAVVHRRSAVVPKRGKQHFSRENERKTRQVGTGLPRLDGFIPFLMMAVDGRLATTVEAAAIFIPSSAKVPHCKT